MFEPFSNLKVHEVPVVTRFVKSPPKREVKKVNLKLSERFIVQGTDTEQTSKTNSNFKVSNSNAKLISLPGIETVLLSSNVRSPATKNNEDLNLVMT